MVSCAWTGELASLLALPSPYATSRCQPTSLDLRYNPALYLLQRGMYVCEYLSPFTTPVRECIYMYPHTFDDTTPTY
ncbi:hypothetical protein GGS23DRAFT_544166, partial [Durotheca rogersii]|uniref:uncharacterized protein n=1 Tax=Durotheca rogersii TaxID=419775 RepID=UPI0022204FE3